MDVELVGRDAVDPARGRRPPLPHRPVAAADDASGDADDLEVVEGEMPDRPRRRLPAQHREPGPSVARAATTRSTATGWCTSSASATARPSTATASSAPTGSLAEQEAGRPLWAGLAEPASCRCATTAGARARRMKDASSTDVVVHSGMALTQLLPVRRPLPARPADAARRSARRRGTAGSRSTGASRRTPRSTSAPASCCSSTTARTAPYLHYGVVDAARRPRPLHRRPAARAAAAARHGVHRALRDPQRLPAVLGPRAARERTSTPPRFHRDLPIRFAVIPRRGADVATSAGSRPTRPTSCTSSTPTRTATRSCSTASSRATRSPADNGMGDQWQRAFRFLALDRMQSRLHRWRLNLVTGRRQGGAAAATASPSSG